MLLVNRFLGKMSLIVFSDETFELVLQIHSIFCPFLPAGAGLGRCRAVLQQRSTMKDLHIKVSDEEHTALIAICRQQERTISDVLREKIRQLISENKAQVKERTHR